MPLLEAWEPQPHSLAATWRIDEPEEYFVARTGIQSDIRNEKRRMERLAGRYLLQHLKADFPVHHIFPDEHDKPRVPADQYFFSISHSYPYVAAMVSDRVECGIDIQAWHPRMEALQHKFLSPEEQYYFKNDVKLLTLAWSAKEAAYKWLGRRGIEFIEQLPITHFSEQGSAYRFIINTIIPEREAEVQLSAFLSQDFSLALSLY